MVGKVKKLLTLNIIRRCRTDVSTCYKSASGSRCYCGSNMDNNSSYQEVYEGRKIVEHTIDQLTFMRIIFGNLSASGE